MCGSPSGIVNLINSKLTNMKLSAIILLITLMPVLNAQADQFRGSLRDGIYPDTDLLDQWPDEGPELLAEINNIGVGYGSPSFNEKGMYIAGMEEDKAYLYHFSNDYTLQWKVSYGDDFRYKYTGSRATPTLDDNRVYYSGTYGKTMCLDNGSGALLWEKNLFNELGADTIKWGYTESPLIYKNLIILTPGAPEHSVVALDKMNGEMLWTLHLDNCRNAYNSPVLIRHHDEDLVMLTTTTHLLLFRPLSGELVFSHPIPHGSNMHALSPLYRDGKIFYTSGYGEGSTLFSLNENLGIMDTLYHNTDLDCKLSGLIEVNGTVFGTSDKKKQWVAVDLESGNTVFTSRALKPGSFVMADGKFFIFTETGEVALARPARDGFSIVNRFHIPEKSVKMAFAHPVIHQGKLYIRYRGQVWVYRLFE